MRCRSAGVYIIHFDDSISVRGAIAHGSKDHDFAILDFLITSFKGQKDDQPQ